MDDERDMLFHIHKLVFPCMDDIKMHPKHITNNILKLIIRQHILFKPIFFLKDFILFYMVSPLVMVIH